MTLDELKAALDGLSPVKVSFVARAIDALANPPSLDIRSAGTWLTATPDWMEYFGLALSVHHGATTEPLKLTAFETVFRNACEHVEWAVDPPGSPTRRFVDLTVQTTDSEPERRLSLKSTAAKDLRETYAHISKLTESAWIQDQRTATGRRNRMRELFRQYQEAVSAIIMLRAFRTAPDPVPDRYQLLEIPASIFDAVQQAPLNLFHRDDPEIECQIDGKLAAIVKVDRSDAKITVRRVQLSACTVHAEWRRE